MTNEQMSLSVGLPIVANSAMMLIGFTLLNSRISDMGAYLGKRIDDTNKRIDDLRADVAGISARSEMLTGKVYELMGSK